MAINPITGLEEEIDPVTGLPIEMRDPFSAPVEAQVQVPEAPIAQSPIDVTSYLKDKYGLNSKYSDSARDQVVQDNQTGLGAGLVGALASLGAGFQGKDSVAAGLGAVNNIRDANSKNIDQFDKNRKQAIEQQGLDRAESEFQRTEQDRSDSKDPMSERSIAAQQMLVQDFGMSPDVASKLSAEQIEARVPSLKFKLDKDFKEKQAAQSDKFKEREFNIKERELTNKKAEQVIKQEERQDKAKEGKQNQYMAAGYGKRVEQAEKAFDNIAKSGYDRSSIGSGIGSMFPNILRQDEAVQQDQAERNFINAVLRRESGAAIAPSEFESAEAQYLPRAGDGADTLKQKEENRKMVLESLKKEAGKVWDEDSSVNQSKEETKMVAGKKFMKVPGGWREVK